MSNEQFAAVLGVVATFLGSVITTVKWVANRFAKVIDASTAQRAEDAKALAALQAELVALRAMVREARDDMREARAIAEQLRDRPRPRQRVATPPRRARENRGRR